MDTPGYDPVSMTGIVAGGANVLVFTTGRGSVFGCKPAPSIKVATNTPMYEHMIDDMDINAGVILDGTPVEEVGRQIFEEILAVASGKKTKSEINGVGEEEFAPWASGRRCKKKTNHRGHRVNTKEEKQNNMAAFRKSVFRFPLRRLCVLFSVSSVPLWFVSGGPS